MYLVGMKTRKLNFNLVELRVDNNPVSTFRLKELKTNKILSHKYTLIFIELSKFAKRLEEISPDNILEGYLYFLRNMHNFKEQPKTKGMAEEKMTIAKSMKLEGISVDIICKCTGLSIEEIENL